MEEDKHDIPEKVRKHLDKKLNVVEYDRKYGPIDGAISKEALSSFTVTRRLLRNKGKQYENMGDLA